MCRILRNNNFVILIPLIVVLVWLSFCFVSCNRTVKKVTEVRDTLHVYHQQTDSSLIEHVGQNIELTKEQDSFVHIAKDTIIKTIFQRDSILLHDSIYVKEKGDSVYIYKERWNTKIVLKYDTLYKLKTDTVLKFRTDTLIKNNVDTLVVFKYINNKDSLYSSKENNKEILKEKKRYSWLKVVGALLFLYICLLVWQKSKNKQ